MTADEGAVARSDAETERLARWLRDMPSLAEHGRLLGRGYQASAWLLDSPAGAVVVKEAHPSAVLGPLGRRALRREAAIYRRLCGILGIPRFLGLFGGRLVLEHVDGPSLRAYEKRLEDPERFFSRLLETIDAMHAAGVAHGDLKRKDNVLVGPGERPYVIDFGIAWQADDDAPRWRRAIFDALCQMDYNAWVKLKYRRRYEDISTADAERYRPLLLERVARTIRVPWQKLTLRRLRKRRRHPELGPR